MDLTVGERKRFEKHYQRQREWSDHFLKYIPRELGEAFIIPAPEYEDTKENTDLMVFKQRNCTYAARVRHHQYHDKFKDEFTIRCSVSSGGQTELDKVLKGFGDYMFYGIANENRDGFLRYSIIDLEVFRRQYNLLKGRGPIYNFQDNTAFKAFDYREFSDDLIFYRKVA